MPVQHNHGMSADDAFNPLFGRSLEKPELMPVSKGELGGRPQQNGGRQRPIAGAQVGHHNPMHTSADACCGQVWVKFSGDNFCRNRNKNDFLELIILVFQNAVHLVNPMRTRNWLILTNNVRRALMKLIGLLWVSKWAPWTIWTWWIWLWWI